MAERGEKCDTEGGDTLAKLNVTLRAGKLERAEKFM